MVLSVIVPSITGELPTSIPDDPRLEVVVVKGVSPVGRARNEGLRRAHGDYIAWIDADDEVTADWLPSVLTALETAPDVVVIDSATERWSDEWKCSWGVSPASVSIERLRRDVYRDLVRPSMLCLYIVKRNLWDGIAFDEKVRVAEDLLILPKVLARAKDCLYIPRLLYRYIRNDRGLTSTQRYDRFGEVIDLWERRLAEAPHDYRTVCAWGLAVSCYWICSRVALDDRIRESPGAEDCARRCRALIAADSGVLLKEALFGKDLSLRERVVWGVKFFSAATDRWWLQKAKRRFSVRRTNLSTEAGSR